MEESVKTAIESANSRGDAVYLAVFVMVLCCVLLIAVGFALWKSLPNMFSSYREEIAKEREFYLANVKNERDFHRETLSTEREFYKTQLDHLVQEQRHSNAEVCREIKNSSDQLTRAVTELRTEIRYKKGETHAG